MESFTGDRARWSGVILHLNCISWIRRFPLIWSNQWINRWAWLPPVENLGDKSIELEWFWIHFCFAQISTTRSSSSSPPPSSQCFCRGVLFVQRAICSPCIRIIIQIVEIFFFSAAKKSDSIVNKTTPLLSKIEKRTRSTIEDRLCQWENVLMRFQHDDS